MENTIRLRLRLQGVVQGVGMRPFIYRLATEEQLSGFVYNDGRGVVLEIQGSPPQLERFRCRLVDELPPAARLDRVNTEEIEPSSDQGFSILTSPANGLKFTRLAPDLATCDDCLQEISDPTNRRYFYPFTNCTNCGPRLTIIRDVPYDRSRTTMSGFQMCAACQQEYDDPQDRRFHAQPNACSFCGPKTFLVNQQGSPLSVSDPLTAAAQALRKGEIVAVKGIGGMHLACDATNSRAVARLRSRKYREEKPFALMVKSLERVHELAFFNSTEEQLLTSTARPVVILDRKPGARVVSEVSPGLDTLGLMLPYTPLHHLLLAACDLPLVMTSGNFAEEPIAFKQEEIVTRLQGIADLFLLHDRPIHLRCDDSVVRVIHGQPLRLRRSRGFVPDPILLPQPLKRHILSCGAELKSTFCLGRDDHLILSHHIGDLENQMVLEAYEEGIEHFQKLFYVQPEEIACDLHPDYLSTQYAQKKTLPLLQVQHHHAHALAAIVETGDFSPALAWTLDGIGWGTDGSWWGGECLLVDGLQWRVLAKLEPLSLPGGEKAIREPWRTAVATLLLSNPRDGFNQAAQLFPHQPVQAIQQILEKGINCPLSSGAGRLFDAVAAIAGVGEEIAYEAQTAILLEALALREDPSALDSLREIEGYALKVNQKNGLIILDWRELIQQVCADRRAGCSPGRIGLKFHAALLQALLKVTVELRGITRLNRVILTGGVFQNRLLLANLWRDLQSAGFEVVVPTQVPINDGGVALGQAAALWLKQCHGK